MGKWEVGKIALITMGQSPSSETYNNQGEGLPFFQGKTDFGLIHPSIRMYCRVPQKTAKINDILMSVRAPVGDVNIADCDCCIGRGLVAISEIPETSYYKYLFHAFQYYKKDIEKLGVGSTFKAISRKDIHTFQIPLPPLEMQRQIADVLDRASALIEKRKAQIEKLDLLVKSRFIEMFGDPVTNPKGWEIKKLGDIADVGSSKRVFVEELVENGIPFYRGTEIGTMAEGENITPSLFITQEHYNELRNATGAPAVGDLLMPSICPDGRVWRVDTDKPFYFKDGRVLWVHLTDQAVDDVYLQYALKERLIADYYSIASGSTFAELKIFSLKSVSILLPPPALQTQYANFIHCIETQKCLLQQSIGLLELNFKSLMQKCFQGEMF